MPDLFPDQPLASSPGPARNVAPESRSAAATLAPTTLVAENAPYRDLFVDVFDRAYDRPGEPGRGARVRTDVEAEARTFGDEWTVQSVAAERFGAATQPGLNDWLADSLRTEAGQQAVLNARKEEALTPGRGDDLVVLLDRGTGWNSPGHTAVLIGNDRTGWDLYSKNGTNGSSLLSGPAAYRGEANPHTRRERLAQHFDTLDAFFREDAVSGRYEAAVRVELGATPEAGAAARRAAERILVEPYDFATSSCAHVVRTALDSAGVGGFSMTETHTSGSGFNTWEAPVGFVNPKRQFGDLRDIEEGDDRPSASQRAWERRSANDGW